MDSASPTLLSRARQGQPHAIATLIQRRLNSREIDVMAWKKQDLLYIELMSFEGLFKADMLSSIQITLSEAMPKGIRATKISSYIYGEEAPRWIGRIAVAAAPARANLSGAASKNIIHALHKCLAASSKAVVATRPRRLVAGAALALGFIGAAISIAQIELPIPSFANRATDESQPVKMRSQGIQP